MTLKTDLEEAVSLIARTKWEVAPGLTVPELTALTLGNTGKTIDACILYADLSDSTGMVDALINWRAAEHYKAFLLCASQIIKNAGGSIEAYDGDRVMGVFLGSARHDNAVKAAFQLNWAMISIVNPTFARVYTTNHRPLVHTVGIDSGNILVCKAGVRGANELIWVGAAANYAAKLNSFPNLEHAYSTRITQTVFNKLPAAWKGNANVRSSGMDLTASTARPTTARASTRHCEGRTRTLAHQLRSFRLR